MHCGRIEEEYHPGRLSECSMRTLLKTFVWTAWIAVVGIGWTMVRHPEVAVSYLAIASEWCAPAGLFVLVIGFGVVFLSDTWIDLRFPDPDDRAHL